MSVCLYWIVSGLAQTLECTWRVLAGGEIGSKSTNFSQATKKLPVILQACQ